MTRPIYEPSLQRTDARLGYTSNQLLRRPAPTPTAAGGIDYAWIKWNQSTVAISPDEWNTIQNFDPFSQDYAEGFVSEPEDTDGMWGLGVDLTTGAIDWNTSSMAAQPFIMATASCWISDTTWATGDVIGVAIAMGTSGVYSDSRRWESTMTVGSDTGLPDDQHLVCSMLIPRSAFPVTGPSSIRCEIYQSSSGDKSFADTTIIAATLRDSTGTFYN